MDLKRLIRNRNTTMGKIVAITKIKDDGYAEITTKQGEIEHHFPIGNLSMGPETGKGLYDEAREELRDIAHYFWDKSDNKWDDLRKVIDELEHDDAEAAHERRYGYDVETPFADNH